MERIKNGRRRGGNEVGCNGGGERKQEEVGKQDGCRKRERVRGEERRGGRGV